MNERDKEFARQAKLPVMHPDWQEAAQAFADLIRDDEREACADTARLALQHIHKVGEIAESAIRARGNT